MHSYTTQCVLHLNETVLSNSFTLTLCYTVQAYVCATLPEAFVPCTDELSSTPALFVITSRLEVFLPILIKGVVYCFRQYIKKCVWHDCFFSNAQIANGAVKCFVVS